jgi:xanthine dehydrogenase YagS FAD-binding subunit
MITAVNVPLVKPGTIQHFNKFSFRKSIDFAVCSVATLITIKSGKVADCSIVLGGIAPSPYRAATAEKYLTGKKINVSVAEETAAKALEGAKPLKMNGHKLPITQTLVKRAILEAAE